MKDTPEIGSLLVFELVPNLTVAGGTNDLADGDRRTLDSLMEASSFVALQMDETISPLKESITLSPFDAAYVAALNYLCPGTIKINIEHPLKKGKRQEIVEHELTPILYSRYRSDALGKDVHLVDMPQKLILAQLLSMRPMEKIGHLVALYQGMPYFRADRLLGHYREQYMLSDINRKEGPILNLPRPGLLVVEHIHAQRLYNQRKI